MLHILADSLEDISKIEEACAGATSNVWDWKLLAQKCSIRFGRRHLVKKSDEKQLLIVCYSRFVSNICNFQSQILNLSWRRSPEKESGEAESEQSCGFRIAGTRCLSEEAPGEPMPNFSFPSINASTRRNKKLQVSPRCSFPHLRNWPGEKAFYPFCLGGSWSG